MEHQWHTDGITYFSKPLVVELRLAFVKSVGCSYRNGKIIDSGVSCESYRLIGVCICGRSAHSVFLAAEGTYLAFHGYAVIMGKKSDPL